MILAGIEAIVKEVLFPHRDFEQEFIQNVPRGSAMEPLDIVYEPC